MCPNLILATDSPQFFSVFPRDRAICTQGLFAAGDCLLEQGDGVTETAHFIVSAAEIAERVQRLGVTRAEYPLPFGKCLLMKADGFA